MSKRRPKWPVLFSSHDDASGLVFVSNPSRFRLVQILCVVRLRPVDKMDGSPDASSEWASQTEGREKNGIEYTSHRRADNHV